MEKIVLDDGVVHLSTMELDEKQDYYEFLYTLAINILEIIKRDIPPYEMYGEED